MPIPCNKEGIVITAAYNRLTDHLSVRLRLFQTLDLIRFDDGRLITMYPWIHTEHMIIEKIFAQQQVMFLKNLATKFSNSTSIMITYMLAENDPLITLHVDGSSTVSQGRYGVFSFGPNGLAIEPYANGTSFTLILGVRGSLLSRWRGLCNLTREKDKPENATMSFTYDPNTSMFYCELRTHVPMRYYFYLKCDGCKTVMGKIIVMDDGDTIIGRVMNRTYIKPDDVTCVILSPHGWEVILTPVTRIFVTEITTVGQTSNMGKRHTRSRIGVHFTIALICVIVLVFLIFLFVFRRKVDAEPSDNMNGLRLRLRYFFLSGEHTVALDRQ